MNPDVAFSDIFELPLRNGVSYASSLRGSGIPMVNMKEIFAYDRISDQGCELAPLTAKEKEGFLLQGGDLLFARQSLTFEGAGKVSLVLDSSQQRTWESHLIRARLNAAKASPAFYYYYFRSPMGRSSIETIVQQVAAAGIRGSDLAKLPVPLPPLDEQRAIAQVLGALDDKIAANAKLADGAESLLDALFDRSVASGATPVALFEAFEVDFGEPFKGSEFSEPATGRPLIRIRDLKTFRSQVWTTETRRNETLVRPGDVLVGMDAEFRATPWVGEPGMLNQRVCRVRGRTTGNAFVSRALRNPLAHIEGYKTGTTVIHLNKSDLEKATVAIPSPAALARFETEAEGLYTLGVTASAENRNLAVIRDTLLPQLMSGKLRVMDAEALVSNAV